MAEQQDVDAPLGALDERFELLSRLGAGGMGVVYRAFDRERGVQVALKTLRSVDPNQVLRFKAEFRALRDLRHPNLIELGELFEREGSWFFTMELIDGVNFLEYVRGAVQLADTSTLTHSVIEGADTEIETRVATPPEISERLAATVSRAPERAARPQCDVDRLRQAVAELARGLATLHDAGKVHRDIKPSNILVEDDGRLVLLDFGVVAELSASRTFEQDRLIGTVKYMAPEQAAGEKVGPAADWYAMGVLMFQALTGQLPFGGGAKSLLLSKRSLTAPSPRSLAAGIPADLERLCERLLAREPADRAGTDEVFEILGIDRSTDTWLWGQASTEGRLFVGRERELETMELALDDSRDHSVCVLVEGESGVGKSAAVDHFVQTQRADEPHLVVLRGRCHQRERVSYNAFDGVVDDLTRYLLGRRESRLERMVPDRVGALLKLFPALRAINLFAERAALSFGKVGASDIRGEAFAALRQLLRRLGERRLVLLVIDDLQWADRDSIALLAELVHGSDSPPLCLVATWRTGQGDDLARELERIADDFRRIALAGLSAAESEKLARKLLAEAGGAGADVSQIAAEAAGHPMFIQELVHHSGQRRGTAESIRLDDAIWSRAAQLDDDARELLEAVAVAGAPISQAVALAAIGVAPRRAGARIAALQSGGFVRVAGARSHDMIETYHDRVREAVYSNLPDARRRELHHRVGLALDAAGAAPDALFQQFEAAGDVERASRYVVAAAEQAYATMAFGRAVELYRWALEGESDPKRRGALQETLGEALCNDGRSAEAADAFLAAAEGETDATRQLDLQRRAAERLLMSGHLHRGMETTQRVLDRLGMTMPETKTRTIASILWSQLRLRTHSLTWKSGAGSEWSRIKADVFWSFGAGFSMIDMLRGAYFASKAPLLAFKHGDPMQISRALCAAALGAAVMGRGAQVDRLLSATERAAIEDGSALARYYLLHSRTTALFIRDNDWRACLASLRELRTLWREAGRGPGWETDFSTHFECASYQMLGEYREMERRVAAAVREAERTGNLFLEVSMRVRFAGRYLMRGQWLLAGQDVEDALAAWLPESDSFGNQRTWALLTRTRIALCSGELERFIPELDDEWAIMRRSLIGRVPLMRLEWYPTYGAYLCGKAYLAKRRGELGEHGRLCRAALRYADELSRMRYPAAPQSEFLLRAVVSLARGDRARAAIDVRRALDGQRAHPTLVFEWPLQLRLGELLGGTEGEALIDEAVREAAKRGITDLRTFAQIGVPNADVAG